MESHDDSDDAGAVSSFIRAPQILVAEDDRVHREVVREFLEPVGCRLDFSFDGKDVVSRYSTSAYDLVLMDVQMPVMDGYEASEAIRKIERNRGVHVPIIAMSSDLNEFDRDGVRTGTMDGRLDKPIKLPSLIQVLGEHLSHLVIDRDVDTSHVAIPAGPFDIRVALHSVGGKTERLHRLVGILIDDMPKQYQTIIESLTKGDLKTAFRALHTLKGQSAYIGASEVLKFVNEVEQRMLREELNLEDEPLRILNLELRVLCNILKRLSISDIEEAD